jgi:hypothetical protein
MVVFVMALNGQRPPDHLPVDHTQVAADIETLHHASKKKDEVLFYYYYYYYYRKFLHGFQVPFFEILINRSNPHIAAV